MSKIIQPSDNFFKIIEHYECAGDVTKYLTGYIDAVGIPTCGFGTTKYPNGNKVKVGDKITVDEAKHFLINDTKYFASKIDDFCRDDINQNEFDALLSFCYNCGDSNFKSSTLLKLVNEKCTDISLITKWFVAWNKGMVKGKMLVLDGLTKRRQTEANLYCSGSVLFY